MNAKVLSLRERVSVPMLVWLVVLWLLLWGDLSWRTSCPGRCSACS